MPTHRSPLVSDPGPTSGTPQALLGGAMVVLGDKLFAGTYE
jgi:hypothetical protein